MIKTTTRAQALQVKPGALSARSKRRLDQARRLIEQVAYDWSEIPGGGSAVSFDCDQIAEALDVAAATVSNATTWLRQTDDGEPFDG